jgi:hypothetical protein
MLHYQKALAWYCTLSKRTQSLQTHVFQPLRLLRLKKLLLRLLQLLMLLQLQPLRKKISLNLLKLHSLYSESPRKRVFFLLLVEKS